MIGKRTGKKVRNAPCNPRCCRWISGPLLHRTDLHVEVPQVKFREISDEYTRETSAEIRVRVIAARQRQQMRFTHKPKITCFARLGPKEFCALDDGTKEWLKMAMEELNF